MLLEINHYTGFNEKKVSNSNLIDKNTQVVIPVLPFQAHPKSEKSLKTYITARTVNIKLILPISVSNF